MKYPFLMLLSLLPLITGAKEKNVGDVLTQFNIKYQPQKIYVETDRNYYLPGETIFLSSWILNSITGIVENRDLWVNAELIAPDKSLVKRYLLLVKKGRVEGSITLGLDVLPGQYQLNLYTGWSYNLGNDFVTTKPLFVLSESSKLPDYKLTKTIKTGTKGDSLMLTLDFPVDDNTPNYGSYKINLGKTSAEGFFSVRNRVAQIAIPIKESAPDKLEIFWDFNTPAGKAIKRQIISKSEAPDIKFYPESGWLLADKNCKVAMEAIKISNGLPLQLDGEITEVQSGKKITTVSTGNDGMGAFSFTPVANTKYQFTTGGSTKYTYELPEVKSNGAIIKVLSQTATTITLEAAQNGMDGDFTLLGYNSKKELLNKKLSAEALQKIEIPVSGWPAGIIRFALFDKSQNPICERAVFIQPKTNACLSASIVPDSVNARNKLDVKLNLKSANGATIGGSLAVSVVDESQINGQGSDQSTPLSWLLLGSELPGFVRNSAQYIVGNKYYSPEKTDLLMLVKGWSQYEWMKKMLDDNITTASHDTIFYIKGKVLNPLFKRPISGYNVKMSFSLRGQASSGMDVTDKNGEFVFRFPPFVDTLTAFMQVANKNKELTNTLLWIDQPWERVNIDMFSAAEVKSRDEKIVGSLNRPDYYVTASEQFVKSDLTEYSRIFNIRNHKRNDDFSIPGGDTITLTEVEIVSQKPLSTRMRKAAEFGNPDYVLEKEEITATASELKSYTSIFDIILAQIPQISYEWFDPEAYPEGALSKKIGSNKYIFVPGANVILKNVNSIYIDGQAVVRTFDDNGDAADTEQTARGNLADVALMPVKNLKSVEFYENPNSNISNDELLTIAPQSQLSFNTGKLVITTVSGGGIHGEARAGSQMFKMPGITLARKIYQPNYAVVDEAKKILADKRKTIFWNPNLTVNENGEALCSFFLTDGGSALHLKASGFGSNGEALIVDTIFDVSWGQAKADLQALTNLKIENDKKMAARVLEFKNCTEMADDIVTLCFTDKTSKNVLPFVNVRNAGFGSVTNVDGEANIVLNRLNNNAVTAFCPGYKDVTIPFAKLSKSKILVEMEPVKITNTKNEDGLKLVQKMMGDFSKNHTDKAVHWNFYTENIYLNGAIWGIGEKQFRYMWQSYGIPDQSYRCDYQKTRTFKTFNYNEQVGFDINRHNSYYPLNADLTVNYAPFAATETYKFYNFIYLGKTVLDHRTCYIVSFEPKPEEYRTGFVGTMYIDSASNALTYAKWKLDPATKKYATFQFFVHENPREDLIAPLTLENEVSYFYTPIGWKMAACREITSFLVNRNSTYKFEKTSVNYLVMDDSRLSVIQKDEKQLERKTMLVKKPVYNNDYWSGIPFISPTVDNNMQIPYLHEITLRY